MINKGATGTYEALLFDVGNVLIEIDFNRAFACWSGHAGEDVARIGRRFTHCPVFERYERGEIDVHRYFESLRGSLGIDITDEQFLEGWNAIFVGEIAGIADLLARAGERFPLYAFSNTNAAHLAEWSTRFADVIEPFKRLFVSCDMGCRKPEPEAFRAVAAQIGVPACRILFFDDAQENVAGARDVGMQAVHVRSVDDVRRALEPLLG